MSTSKTITREDLLNILNKVLLATHGSSMELLWTNPDGNSQTSTMGSGTITVTKDLTVYDGYIAEFRCFYNSGDKTYGFNFKGMSGMFGRVTTERASGNPMYAYTRTWYPSSTMEFTISDCTRIVSNSADVTGQDTGCLVPIRIWGIKMTAIGGGGGGPVDSTDEPTATKIAEFDSNAHMNSTDMTTQALETYVDSLDIQGSVFVDATDVPTAGEIAKFDSTANMNSTDMTTGSGSEVEAFINGLNVSGKLTHITDKFYNTAITISAGTAGTYATYQTIDISKTGYKPIGILNTYVGHGGSYLPLCFFTGTTLYINFYRVGSSAYNVPAEDMSITILYEKE